ncbi:hypothetical protein FDG50_00490 [Clostridium botulinum]|uniref:hypothetical protein n=1 Tax=Clostridium botulinum TaxID=1491 RepID=UPI0014011BE7|nr:hypothetical protein [Clostridium botulinum]MBY6836009.1 hypothetical protein [Clostridium botulinum]NFG66230.1 hypothetical protein [Clostridium botulinum]NFQ22626.1 hypothetical protein [Clostridium botulinum]
MSAKNKVVNGDYINERVYKEILGKNLSIGGKKSIFKTNVKKYEVIDQTTSKGAISAIIRGSLGIALLGGVGILAGLSAKSKVIHLVAIEFNDGKRSLLEIDEKLYKVFRTNMF